MQASARVQGALICEAATIDNVGAEQCTTVRTAFILLAVNSLAVWGLSQFAHHSKSFPLSCKSVHTLSTDALWSDTAAHTMTQCSWHAQQQVLEDFSTLAFYM